MNLPFSVTCVARKGASSAARTGVGVLKNRISRRIVDGFTAAGLALGRQRFTTRATLPVNQPSRGTLLGSRRSRSLTGPIPPSEPSRADSALVRALYEGNE